ncbi:hypothetical protein [Agrobacterium tumefaciens]|uniref:hypothetical protein n=1 Tax=Agrobacterium tumefaciens TaxID=358 RepID=UPI003BA1D7F0
MGKKLGCHFVGHREKTEKSRCSSAPSCPFDTAALLPEQRELSGMVPHFQADSCQGQMYRAQFLSEQTGKSCCFSPDAGEAA